MLDLKEVITCFPKTVLWTVSTFDMFENWTHWGSGPFVNESARKSISVDTFHGILELGGP